MCAREHSAKIIQEYATEAVCDDQDVHFNTCESMVDFMIDSTPF